MLTTNSISPGGIGTLVIYLMSLIRNALMMYEKINDDTLYQLDDVAAIAPSYWTTFFRYQMINYHKTIRSLEKCL